MRLPDWIGAEIEGTVLGPNGFVLPIQTLIERYGEEGVIKTQYGGITGDMGSAQVELQPEKCPPKYLGVLVRNFRGLLTELMKMLPRGAKVLFKGEVNGSDSPSFAKPGTLEEMRPSPRYPALVSSLREERQRDPDRIFIEDGVSRVARANALHLHFSSEGPQCDPLVSESGAMLLSALTHGGLILAEEMVREFGLGKPGRMARLWSGWASPDRLPRPLAFREPSGWIDAIGKIPALMGWDEEGGRYFTDLKNPSDPWNRTHASALWWVARVSGWEVPGWDPRRRWVEFRGLPSVEVDMFEVVLKRFCDFVGKVMTEETFLELAPETWWEVARGNVDVVRGERTKVAFG